MVRCFDIKNEDIFNDAFFDLQIMIFWFEPFHGAA